MAPSGTPGITSDRLSNLASLLQSKPANNSESQSQIVLDDSNTTPRLPIVSQSLENHINDSDVKSDLKHRIQDSDNERPSREGRTRLTTSNDNETQQPTPPQSKITRKSRHRDANRRFTLDCQDEKVEGVGATLIFRITNWATDSSVTLRLRNIPEFTQNVADRPEDWWHGINELETTASEMSERLAEFESIIDQLQISHTAQTNKFNDLQSQYNFVQEQLMDAQSRIISTEKYGRQEANKQKQETSRLRQLKNEHRQKSDKYAEEFRGLRADKEFLEKEIRGLKAKQSGLTVPQNSESDEDIFYRGRRRQNPFSTLDQAPAFDRVRFSDFSRPLELLARHPARNNDTEERPRIAVFGEPFGLITSLGSNDHRVLPHEKIEDIKDYYGDHAEWKSWKNEVLTKFWISARQYSIEQHKISYVRKHLKSVAYDAVAYRAQVGSVYPYNTFDEMLKNLEQAFGKRDEVSKKTSELFSNGFFMSFKNKNETFNEFMVRFNSLAVPLRVNDNIKINELKKKVTPSMRYRMEYFKKIKNWHEFVKHCRDVYEDMEEMNQYKTDKAPTATSKIIRVSRSSRTIKDPKSDKQQDSIESRVSRNRTDYRATRLSNHIVERLRKEKKCFRCFKKDHTSRNKNAPCKNEDPATEDQLPAALAAVGIEWDEVGEEDWDDMTDDDASNLSSENESQTEN